MTTPADPNANANASPPTRAVVSDATCVACGCLCDDIELTVEGDRIIEAARACDAGRAWFLADRIEGRPEATIDGRPVPIEEAMDFAAEILRRAKAPIVTGLTAATIEAQAVAVALADRIGAVIDPAHASEARPRAIAEQRVGAVWASFGEVKNRADVVVFWGVDPMTTHPRLWDRLIAPPGRFVPEGRSGRTVLVADDGRSEVRSRADRALTVLPGRHTETLRVLRAAVRGIEVDAARVDRTTGLSLDDLRAWADLLKSGRYGAVFFGSELAGEGTAAVEAMMQLVHDLNPFHRFVTVPLAGPGNPAGAEAVMTGRLGAPLSVDLSDGSPRYRPGDADFKVRRDRGETDAVLVVSGGMPSSSAMDARDWPNVSAIVIGPEATASSASAPGSGVRIASATPGIDAGGSVMRSDEVMLPLRPALSADRPTDRDVLAGLLDRIRQGGTISRGVSKSRK